MSRRTLIGSTGAALIAGTIAFFPARGSAAQPRFPYQLSDAEWRRRLSPTAYKVLRRADTERAGSSQLDREKRPGTFVCAGCDLPLFSSDTKFDSGTGWPSFWAEIEGAVGYNEDTSLFMVRVEEHCRRCGGHLGHVFDDGPPPTGKRHCINGVAMRFVPLRA